jgi:hypothetical protein
MIGKKSVINASTLSFIKRFRRKVVAFLIIRSEISRHRWNHGKPPDPFFTSVRLVEQRLEDSTQFSSCNKEQLNAKLETFYHSLSEILHPLAIHWFHPQSLVPNLLVLLLRPFFGGAKKYR